jgi:hypothetical protein
VELGSFAVVFSVFTRALYELSAKSNEKLTSNKIASFNGVQARKKRKDRDIRDRERTRGMLKKCLPNFIITVLILIYKSTKSIQEDKIK